MIEQMSKEEWIQAVGRGFARTMPDMFPEGYAYYLATYKADRGAYEAFLAGEFADESLYEPRGEWD
jgi:hypothetical protein